MSLVTLLARVRTRTCGTSESLNSHIKTLRVQATNPYWLMKQIHKLVGKYVSACWPTLFHATHVAVVWVGRNVFDRFREWHQSDKPDPGSRTLVDIWSKRLDEEWQASRPMRALITSMAQVVVTDPDDRVFRVSRVPLVEHVANVTEATGDSDDSDDDAWRVAFGSNAGGSDADGARTNDSDPGDAGGSGADGARTNGDAVRDSYTLQCSCNVACMTGVACRHMIAASSEFGKMGKAVQDRASFCQPWMLAHNASTFTGLTGLGYTWPMGYTADSLLPALWLAESRTRSKNRRAEEHNFDLRMFACCVPLSQVDSQLVFVCACVCNAHCACVSYVRACVRVRELSATVCACSVWFSCDARSNLHSVSGRSTPCCQPALPVSWGT